MKLLFDRRTKNYAVFVEAVDDLPYILYMPLDDWIDLMRPREVEYEPKVL